MRIKSLFRFIDYSSTDESLLGSAGSPGWGFDVSHRRRLCRVLPLVLVFFAALTFCFFSSSAVAELVPAPRAPLEPALRQSNADSLVGKRRSAASWTDAHFSPADDLYGSGLFLNQSNSTPRYWKKIMYPPTGAFLIIRVTIIRSYFLPIFFRPYTS